MVFGRIDDGKKQVRSTARYAYLVLRDRIIQCTIPPLQKLKIADLASELKTSPGAIREALSRLASEGLAVAEDQRGFRATAISLADLDDLTEARIDVETLLLRRSIARGDDDWRDAVRSASAALEDFAGDRATPEAAALHEAFHQTLVAASGNATLLRTRETLFEMSQRYRYFAIRAGDVERPVQDEHDAIVTAAVARDADAAAAAMADHIYNTSAVIRQALLSDASPG